MDNQNFQQPIVQQKKKGKVPPAEKHDTYADI
jgi:hypothetical protein